jgi:hypothetical protein
VYQSREADVELKRELHAQKGWLTQNDKMNLEAEVQRQNLAFETKQLADALARKNHQTDVLRQVGERDRQVRREMQGKLYDERAAKLAEIEYQRRIDNEKQTN